MRGGQCGNTFVDNGNGTVTDSSTSLMWQKDTARDGQGNIKSMAWQDALFYCECLGLAQYTDWRLPTIRELRSIVYYDSYAPSIAPVFAETVGDDYWSSTTYAGYPGDAQGVSFYYTWGFCSYKANLYYVRAVRGGLFGSLCVVIEPSGARSAEAKWRRVASATWHDSDYTEGGVPAGSQSVEYKPVAGWEAPSMAMVNIDHGEVAGATGAYLAQEMSYVDNLDASCGGKSPCFQSIQSALAAQGAAKLIKVRGGVYDEELNLSKSQIATIRGDIQVVFHL